MAAKKKTVTKKPVAKKKVATKKPTAAKKKKSAAKKPVAKKKVPAKKKTATKKTAAKKPAAKKKKLAAKKPVANKKVPAKKKTSTKKKSVNKAVIQATTITAVLTSNSSPTVRTPEEITSMVVEESFIPIQEMLQTPEPAEEEHIVEAPPVKSRFTLVHVGEIYLVTIFFSLIILGVAYWSVAMSDVFGWTSVITDSSQFIAQKVSLL